MNKYISVEVAKEYLRHDSFDNPYFRSQACQQAMDILDTVPASDVVEVRHGRWHRYSKGSGSYNGVIILSDAFQCTICKKSFWNKSDYCPNCGAKMDGDKDNV